MSKAFLSHSSFDKDFVEKVFDILGAGKCVYDKVTFKRNTDLPNQIRQGIEGCDVYVLFLSAAALSSDWVNAELDLAYELKARWQVKKFLVFQLDSTPWNELPSWLGRYIVSSPPSPNHVALRIMDELRPYREYEPNCIGRSDEIQNTIYELDELDNTPIYFYLSGPAGIGRRTFATELYRTYYRDIAAHKIFIKIDAIDSITDIFHKTLAFSANWRARDYRQQVDEFSSLDDEAQIKRLAELLFDVTTSFRQVLIIDLGVSALTEEGKPQLWFDKLLHSLKKSDYPYIWFLSQRYLDGVSLDTGVFISVPPLSEKWSATLFKILIKEFKISFPNKEEQKTVEENISGHPGLISIVTNYLRKNPNYKPIGTHNKIVQLINREIQRILSDFLSSKVERELAVGLFYEAHIMSYGEISLISNHWPNFNKSIDELIDAGLLVTSNSDYFLVSYIQRAASSYAEKHADELQIPKRILLDAFDSMTDDSYVPINILDERIVEHITKGIPVTSYLSNLIRPSQQIKAAKRNYDVQNYELSLHLAKQAYIQTSKLSHNGRREAWKLIGLSAIKDRNDNEFSYFNAEYLRLPKSPQTDSSYYFAHGLKERLDGNLKNAITWYEKINQNKFSDVHVYRELGYIYAFERNFHEAIECVTKALHLAFGNPYILDIMVMILIEQYKQNRNADIIHKIDDYLYELKQADIRDGTNFYYARVKIRDIIANNDTASLFELYKNRKKLPISAQTALLDILSFKDKTTQYTELLSELNKLSLDKNNYMVRVEIDRINFEHLAYNEKHAEARAVFNKIKSKLTDKCIEDMVRLLPS